MKKTKPVQQQKKKRKRRKPPQKVYASNEVKKSKDGVKVDHESIQESAYFMGGIVSAVTSLMCFFGQDQGMEPELFFASVIFACISMVLFYYWNYSSSYFFVDLKAGHFLERNKFMDNSSEKVLAKFEEVNSIGVAADMENISGDRDLRPEYFVSLILNSGNQVSFSNRKSSYHSALAIAKSLSKVTSIPMAESSQEKTVVAQIINDQFVVRTVPIKGNTFLSRHLKRISVFFFLLIAASAIFMVVLYFCRIITFKPV